MMSDKPDTATKGPPAPAAKPASVTAGQSDRQGQQSVISIVRISRRFSPTLSAASSSMGRLCASSSRVTRLDDVRANTPLTGRRYPASRIVLPPTAAVDLINRMQQIAAALRQAGVVKAAQRLGDLPKAR